MCKWRITAAAAAMALLAACTPDAKESETSRVAAVAPQPTPWMSVMLRFGTLKSVGSASDELARRLLELAQGRVLASADPAPPEIPTPRDIVSAATRPPLDSLAVRVARKLGARLVRAFAGRASFYASGSRVASGDVFIPEAMTAAHRTLPFGTRLRVTDAKTGRSVVVIVNDRGPYAGGRVLDLSLGAARALGMTARGVIDIEAEVI